MGGPSAEHEVSLQTGRVILNALDKKKYNLLPIKITKSGKWLMLPKTNLLRSGKSNTKSIVLRRGEVLNKSELKNIDVFFVAMHGSYGEDGTLQGLLELTKIPYTGSGVLSSALAMDKEKSSELFLYHGLKVPVYFCFSFDEWPANQKKIVYRLGKLGFPVVIKPSNCGSSVGISIVRKPLQVKKAIKKAAAFSKRLMAQKYIKGAEVTCAILDQGGNHKPLTLPPTEIIPKHSEFFDYEAKYTAGATEEITPPRLAEKMIRKIQKTALLAHKILGCSGLSRTDMIVKRNEIFVLELNTIPGMTETSLYPQAAAAVGISFPKLLDRIIKAAFNKR